MANDLIHMQELIGKNLRKLRNIKEMTINHSAQYIEFSSGYLSHVETGKRKIKPNDLRTLLNLYGYSLGRFLSEISDGIEEFNYDPNKLIQKNDQSILLDGSREKGKFSMVLLRPIRHENDIELIRLCLPPDSEMSHETFTVDAEIRGVVVEGELLLVFKKDEERVYKGEEFLIEKNLAHTYRNHTRKPAEVLLIISPPNF